MMKFGWKSFEVLLSVLEVLNEVSDVWMLKEYWKESFPLFAASLASILFTMLAIIMEVDFAITIGVDWAYTSITVDRIWNVMENWVMVALPMFIFMGLLLDRSGIANRLMTSFARLLGPVNGGLAITVTLIGLLLAATTGIIGASVVLLALLGLPVMLKEGYDERLATGTVCAVGTLGILIPPSIMLV